MIYVQIGNSFTHICVYKGKVHSYITEKLTFYEREIESLLKQYKRRAEGVVILSVCEEGQRFIAKKAFEISVRVYIYSRKKLLSICSSSYRQIDSLGLDRLYLAAYISRKYKSAMVFDFGTYVTLDYIRNGHHYGGEIIPNTQKMEQAFFYRTRKTYLGGSEPIVPKGIYGDTTAGCLFLGCRSLMRQWFLHKISDLGEQKYFVFGKGIKPIEDLIDQRVYRDIFKTYEVLSDAWEEYKMSRVRL